VRVVVPIPDGATSEDIEQGAVGFVQTLFPHLEKYLPS